MYMRSEMPVSFTAFADKVNNESYIYGDAKAVLTADIVANKNVLNDGELYERCRWIT